MFKWYVAVRISNAIINIVNIRWWKILYDHHMFAIRSFIKVIWIHYNFDKKCTRHMLRSESLLRSLYKKGGPIWGNQRQLTWEQPCINLGFICSERCFISMESVGARCAESHNQYSYLEMVRYVNWDEVVRSIRVAERLTVDIIS